jgi:arsenite oxidase small subunit
VRLASLPFAAGVKVGNINTLTTGQPVYIHYPDKQALAILVKLGTPAIGGVGPQGDIVVFSAYTVVEVPSVNVPVEP